MKRTLTKNFVKAMVIFLFVMTGLPSVALAQISSDSEHTQAEDYAKILYFPGLNSGRDWQGCINITNLESTDSDINLEPYDEDGNLLEIKEGLGNPEINCETGYLRNTHSPIFAVNRNDSDNILTDFQIIGK